LQAALGLGDPALAVLPRLAVAAAGLAALGPWMGRELVALAARAFSGVP
ncbi:MAG: flagellar biosynthetic protein FliQ, partial [Deltaproteobacteria bacterium]|nr:flagellar biosynthetic protein FliQ [Deltaproteobacteria bacterium]